MPPLPPLSRLLLLPLEKLFEAVVRARRAWYLRHPERRYLAPVPVVSIGNLSVGGSGKTPMAIWLMEQAQAMGYRPAYLSRGYGRTTKGFRSVSPASRASEVGDEALMVARRFPQLPVAVCESREQGIRRLLEQASPGLILLDDAFQHLAVHRQLDLVLIDAGRLPDEDAVMPAGRLREPLSSLQFADFLLLTKIPDEPAWKRLAFRFQPWGKPLAGSGIAYQSLMDLAGRHQPWPDLRGQEAILVSALASNDSFRKAMEAQGLTILHHQTHRDHRPFQYADAEALSRLASAHPQAWLLTTEKDLMRWLDLPGLPEPLPQRLRAACMGLHWWGGEETISRALKELFQSQNTE